MKTWGASLVGGLIFICLSLQVLAGGGPCNYIVLYDQTDTNSIAVANYYQQVRDIPERNMVPYTFFPAGKTSFASNDLWNLTLHLRQVIQDRGLTGRFNGIAVAGTVPLMGKTDRLGFQTGLYYAPNLSAPDYDSYFSDNLAFAQPPTQPTREMRDDKPYISGGTTNVYWPISFVGFTGVNGNTPEEVFALLDRSKAADGLRPDGTVYWPTNSNIRSTTRAWEISDVAPVWNARGIRYLIDGGGPMSINTGCGDIAGVFGGTAQADIGINGNTYTPGAWADHLTSNGGNLNTLINGQSSACAWLRAGAYGSSGTASEPLAISEKFPHAHIHTHLRAGASQAEAFWQSLQTPYEIVMVGDPLLQAWAQIPQVTVSSPANGAMLSGTIAINASASTVHPDGLEAQYELAIDGHIVRIGSTNETISAAWTGSGFSLNTATLADGWHDLRVVAYNNNAIHTQGEARRTVLVNNSSQSITLTGPSSLEYTSNGTFTVNLSGVATATHVTIQANGRTLATLPSGGGSTNLSAGLFGYQGTTKLYALAWLNNGKQVWSAPLDVSLVWTPSAATNVTPGASVAQIRCFGDTVSPGFDWDSAVPDTITNYMGPVLTEGFKTLIDYRSFSVSTNDLTSFSPASYANKPGFDSTMYFLAPADGLYEFMVNSTSIAGIVMEVDGKVIQHGTSTSDGTIKPAPVKLAAGFHPVRLRFQATAANYLAELWYRGGITPGNMNVDTYSNYLVQRMNEIVCFGPAIEGNAPPVITNAVSALPIKTTQKLLLVGAADPDGDSATLIYSWAKIDGPGNVKIPANATTTCFTNLATFSRAGNYRLRVMISDGSSVATGEVTAVVTSAYSTIIMSSTGLTMRAGTSVQLSAIQKDQFGTGFTNRPFVWSVLGGGSVTSNGLYTAPVTVGTNQVVVNVGSYGATNTISVISNFVPVISSVQLANHGDHIQCFVNATDDLGTNNLTYTWMSVGTNTATFSANGTSENPVDGYFTRFGTYKVKVGVTDSSGATAWSGTNTILIAAPTVVGTLLVDTNGNQDGRLDPNESADLFVKLQRNDLGTNAAVSAVLSVTNTPGLTVSQSTSGYPAVFDEISRSASNFVPFRLDAGVGLISTNPKTLMLKVNIGSASCTLPIILPATPYVLTESMGATIVPGTNDVGMHDQYYGGMYLDLPFAYNFGGQSFTRVFVNGNGLLQFSSQDLYNSYGDFPVAYWANFIAVHWEMLRLDLPGKGIFTSVSGTAPNRIFNIEWRAVRYNNTNDSINCETRLYEAEPRVDLIYGTVGNSGERVTVGLQVNPNSYVEYSRRQPVLTNGLQLSFVLTTNSSTIPAAGFVASPGSGWVPLAVSFTDTSTGLITNRFWDFGDGDTTNTTATSVAHTYTATGNKTVQLIVSGPDGVSTNTQVDCIQVTTPVAPSAGFTLTPASGAVPLAVSFTDTSTGSITNRFWSFGDGSTTNTMATSVSHTYTSVGTNTVQLIVSGPSGVSTNSQIAAVIVTPPAAPVANFSATPTAGTAPLAVTFTDTSTGTITNRFWNFGDGGTTNTTAASVSHTYTVAGTNTVQLIVSGPGGVSTNTQAGLVSVAAAALPALLVDLSGNYNTSSGNINFTKPTETTVGEARIYDNDLSTPLIAKGAAGSGGSYIGPSIYGAFRQSVAGGPPVTFTTFRMGGDSLALTPSSTLINSGVLDILYVFKKADFANGLNTGPIGFGASSTFSVTTGSYNASTKCLRAVVQNGSTWYISVASNTVASGTTNPKIIMTNASAALWSVWDPLTSIDTSSQDFSTTVAGSTFTDIQAVGIYDQCKSSAAFLINFNSIQIGGVAVSSGGTSYTLTGSAGANGTVSPASTNVSSGGSAAFVITASNYYRIASLTTNGTPVGISFDNNSTVTNFIWNNVQAAGALVATFTNQVTSDPAGTPYLWLAQYGLTNFSTDSFADQDMDGLSAWQEYIAGTGPTNAQSNLSLSLQQTASQKMLQWASVSGRVYSVYWTTNLLNSFQPLETNIVWPQNSWTNGIHETQAGGFYRIKVQFGQ